MLHLSVLKEKQATGIVVMEVVDITGMEEMDQAVMAEAQVVMVVPMEVIDHEK